MENRHRSTAYATRLAPASILPPPSENEREAAVALALADVPVHAPAQQTAAACVSALRPLLGERLRLCVPGQPLPVVAGDDTADLELLARFPVGAGQGELWALPAVRSEAARQAVHEQLARVWRLQDAYAARELEMDRLRFQLQALQQVAHTLAAVRRTDETERLALDSIGEVFFAWWAALYRREPEGYVCRAVRSLRGESVATPLPAAMVQSLLARGEPVVTPPADAEIRDRIQAEIAVIAPLDLGDCGGGLLMLGPRMTDAPYDAHDRALLRALADASAIALRNAELLDRLRVEATIDPLTGCRNRRGFDELLELEFERARRHKRALSLVLVDIDHFKWINDALGHDAGDQALRRIGWTLRHSFRRTDGVCRFGGEEFALVFPETPEAEAMRLAERLRVLIEQLSPDEEMRTTITASLGVAVFPEDADTAAALFRAADQALYRAKGQGRNRVVAASGRGTDADAAGGTSRRHPITPTPERAPSKR